MTSLVFSFIFLFCFVVISTYHIVIKDQEIVLQKYKNISKSLIVPFLMLFFILFLNYRTSFGGKPY
jgi:hypothetical protein